jgi:hypothetical protein
MLQIAEERWEGNRLIFACALGQPWSSVRTIRTTSHRGDARYERAREVLPYKTYRQGSKNCWSMPRIAPSSPNFSNARDQTLIAFYESVRRQVEADKQSGGGSLLGGASTRQPGPGPGAPVGPKIKRRRQSVRKRHPSDP